MFGIFEKKENTNLPEWNNQLQETQKRFYVFLEKLEEKMQEFCEAAIPELENIFKNKKNEDGRLFYQMQSGVDGQLNDIHKKAYTTKDEKIEELFQAVKYNVSVLDKHYYLLTQFRTDCGTRFRSFEDKYQQWRTKISNTSVQDMEIVYNNILEEYEAIKNKFTCKQCSSSLTIEKIFFITTYITCPACQTQNTYEPSTQARNLQHIARNLAHQRTEHLYLKYQNENILEREFYQQRHKLSLSKIHEKDKITIANIEQKMEMLEKKRQQAIAIAPILYKNYLRAMYNEWNIITPDLAEHNEVMYQNEINSK